jgi:outer membrane protein
MRNISKLIIVAILFALPLTLSAQQKPLKFGHVSSEDVLAIMPERDSAIVQLDKFGKGLQEQLEGMNVERNKKVDTYLKEQKTQPELVNKSREDEINQINQRIQQFQEDAQKEYQEEQMKLMQPIIEKIQKAITDVGKENGFIYIFANNSNVIPYISTESVDVTPLVKTKLGLKDKKPATTPAGTK